MEFTKYSSTLLCSIMLSAFLHHSVYGQNSEENEYGSWFVLCGTTKIHKDWSVPAVGILKHNHMVDKYGFFFFRTGASYHISSASTVTGGMALLNSNSYLEQNDVVNTNQIWFYGEYMLKSKIHYQSISQRVRFENRRLIHTEDPKTNNRIRYRLQYVRPLYKDVYLKAFDEVFLNMEGTTFSQNRIFFGVGRQLTKNLKGDIGYFNRRFRNSSENMIRLGLTFQFDLTDNDLAGLPHTDINN
ncbi:MAG: DUF2490 domain-containing protein [Bacteroidota bacterium]|nr:DUF2490 domain-containing protein [Bacteroidota bacterium]